MVSSGSLPALSLDRGHESREFFAPPHSLNNIAGAGRTSEGGGWLMTDYVEWTQAKVAEGPAQSLLRPW